MNQRGGKNTHLNGDIGTGLKEQLENIDVILKGGLV
jgi:hypothetical protein